MCKSSRLTLAFIDAAQNHVQAKQFEFKIYGGNMTKIFPIVLMTLDVLAALGYAWSQDWKHTIYWLAAATLTACVTF